MTLIQAIRRAIRHLNEDREALHLAHVNHATGNVDDAQAREAIQEIDELVNFFANYLAACEREARHV